MSGAQPILSHQLWDLLVLALIFSPLIALAPAAWLHARRAAKRDKELRDYWGLRFSKGLEVCKRLGWLPEDIQ